jgi:hypothetical protein
MLAAMPLLISPAFGQHVRDRAPQVPGSPARVPLPFAQSYALVRDSIERLKAAVDSRNIAEAHAQADAAGDGASDLLATIRTPESRVPKDRFDDAERAAREIIAAADELHVFAERGDLRGCGEEYMRMRRAMRTLTPFAAPEYCCPMHCEGAKVYAAPGKCPVCEMDLKRITTDKYSVDVRPLDPSVGAIAPGSPVTLRFALRDPTGARVKNTRIVHEKPLHLLMVSEDLSWYAHEHPALQTDGTFNLTTTFPAPGTYTLFHDFTPGDEGQQVVPVALTVPGPVPPRVPLQPDHELTRVVDGFSVTLETGGAIKTGAATALRYTLRKDGHPVTDLEPYLGATGHLVIVSQDRASFVHSHPVEARDGAPASHGPSVEFTCHFENPGVYRAWAQFQHGGRVITVPFTFQVIGERVILTPTPHQHGANEKDVGPNAPLKFK